MISTEQFNIKFTSSHPTNHPLPYQRLLTVPHLRREVGVWRAEASAAREEATTAKRTLDEQQEHIEFVLRQTAQVGQTISLSSQGSVTNAL